MTIRVDSNSLIAGKTVVSLYSGNGIQAQNIPSTGTSGAGYLYNDIASQSAQPTDEMRGEILTWPSVGVFTVNEDSSFSFTGAPDGTYTATYRGYKNGVSYGNFTITLNIGAGTSLTVNITKNSLPVASKQMGITLGNILSLNKRAVSLTPIQQGISVGSSVAFNGNLVKNPLTLTNRQLDIVSGVNIPFNGNITRYNLVIAPKPLDVVAGVNIFFNGNIGKQALNVSGKQQGVIANQIIAFYGDMVKTSLNLTGKTLYLADTKYPVINTSRLFFTKTSNRSKYFI